MLSPTFEFRSLKRSILCLLLIASTATTLACAPSDPAPDAPAAAPAEAPAPPAVDPAVAAQALTEMLAGPEGFEGGSATLDLSQVQPGAVLYQMVLNGQPLGSTTVEILQEENTTTVRELTAVPEAGFLQQAAASIDSATHQMLGTTAEGQLGAGISVGVDLKWQDGRVAGHSEFPRQAAGLPDRVELDHELDASILERTILVHLIGAMDLQVGAETPLHVFNAFESRVRGRTVRVVGEEEVVVPAGTFQTLRVEIDGGEPSHVLWVAAEAPRRVVRMELVGQPWIYEMVPPPKRIDQAAGEGAEAPAGE